MVRHRKKESAEKEVSAVEARVEESQLRLADSLERLNFYTTASRTFSSFIARQNERMSTTIRTQGSKESIELCISEAKKKRTDVLTQVISRWTSDVSLLSQRSARLGNYVDAMRQTSTGNFRSSGKSGATVNLPSYEDLISSSVHKIDNTDVAMSAVTCLRPYQNVAVILH